MRNISGKRPRLIGFALLIPILSGSSLPKHDGLFDTQIGTSPIVRSDGATVGQMTVYRELLTIAIDISLNGVAPGQYAVQLGDQGRCDAPTFATAGTGWSNIGKVDADASGQAAQEVDFNAPFVHFGPELFDKDGSALLLLAKAPSTGKAAARFACSVFPPDKK
jgi:Cu/Zn superoxide dismutase